MHADALNRHGRNRADGPRTTNVDSVEAGRIDDEHGQDCQRNRAEKDVDWANQKEEQTSSLDMKTVRG